jgi:hypothetical protein
LGASRPISIRLIHPSKNKLTIPLAYNMNYSIKKLNNRGMIP